MEKKFWWKLLTIPILVYVIVMGLSMPLSPGITSLSDYSAKTGESIKLEIETYNTFHKQAKQVKVRLRKDSTLFLVGTNVKVIDDNNVEATFNIPSYLPSSKEQERFSVDVDNDFDGYGTLPGKFIIKQDQIDSLKGTQVWTNSDFGALSERGTNFPFRGLLYETIRNTFFHVPLWFGMLFLFIAATWNSFMYLRTQDPDRDRRAAVLTSVGLLFGALGIVTGMIWAKSTWGTYWTWKEIKLNMTAIALLIYFAYFVLRNAFDDLEKRARIAAVYNIFAFVAALVLINVIPRMTDSSLHPGNGGNPAFGSEDMDNTLRMVFYPAIIGWTLLGFWIATIQYRMLNIEEKILEGE